MKNFKDSLVNMKTHTCLSNDYVE